MVEINGEGSKIKTIQRTISYNINDIHYENVFTRRYQGSFSNLKKFCLETEIMATAKELIPFLDDIIERKDTETIPMYGRWVASNTGLRFIRAAKIKGEIKEGLLVQDNPPYNFGTISLKDAKLLEQLTEIEDGIIRSKDGTIRFAEAGVETELSLDQKGLDYKAVLENTRIRAVLGRDMTKFFAKKLEESGKNFVFVIENLKNYQVNGNLYSKKQDLSVPSAPPRIENVGVAAFLLGGEKLHLRQYSLNENYLGFFIEKKVLEQVS